MTYSPKASNRGMSRKHLVETLVKEVNLFGNGKKPGIACMMTLRDAVKRYQKEVSK